MRAASWSSAAERALRRTPAGPHTRTRPSTAALQRPFLSAGPYLANLRVLAMSDAKGFQVSMALHCTGWFPRGTSCRSRRRPWRSCAPPPAYHAPHASAPAVRAAPAGPQDDSPWDDLSVPLAPATALEVLRINRCLGLQLALEGARPGSCAGVQAAGAQAWAWPCRPWHAPTPQHTPHPTLPLRLPSPPARPRADVDTLLAAKPRFRKLEFTTDMLSDPRDLAQLRARHPQVTFKAVE